MNTVTVYQLTPEQLRNYTPGMDLGKPVRIYQPESLVQTPDKTPIIISENRPRPLKGRPSPHRKVHITKEEYEDKRKSMTHKAICAELNVPKSTLDGYLKEWGISKPRRTV